MGAPAYGRKAASASRSPPTTGSRSTWTPTSPPSGLADVKGTPLFRTARGKTGMLTENRMTQPDAWRMLQRRAKKAGVTTAICNHTWRASGITVFLENGGAIEMAQYMAGHADPRTTKLYDRRRQQVTRGEVERIRYEKKPGQPE